MKVCQENERKGEFENSGRFFFSFNNKIITNKRAGGSWSFVE